MGQKTKTFFRQLLDSSSPLSSKRFVTLLVAGLFVLTCFTILLLLIFLFISVSKLQGINIEALKTICELLKDVIRFEALITVGGLGFVTIPDFAKILTSAFGKTDASTPQTPE